MSRASDKHKDSPIEEPGSVVSDISDEEDDTEDAEREETPDLYRNSSLGMYVKTILSSTHFLTIRTFRYGGVSITHWMLDRSAC